MNSVNPAKESFRQNVKSVNFFLAALTKREGKEELFTLPTGFGRNAGGIVYTGLQNRNFYIYRFCTLKESQSEIWIQGKDQIKFEAVRLFCKASETFRAVPDRPCPLEKELLRSSGQTSL